MSTFNDITEIAGTYSILLPLFVGFFKFRFKYFAYYYVFLFWLTCSGIANILTVAFASDGNSTILIFHIYTMLEFLLLLLLYYKMGHSEGIQKATIFCMVAFCMFKVVDIFFITGLNQIDTLAIIVESIVMIAFSFLFFAQLINERVPSLAVFPPFWINSGVLIYFSSSFFIFLFSTYILQDTKQYYVYWSIHNILIVVRDILFTIAMIALGKLEANGTYRENPLAIHS